MGEAAHLAILFRRILKVQERKRMGQRRVVGNVQFFQELVADHVWQLAVSRTDAEIDVGFAEINRFQLRMGVGDVQNTSRALHGHLIDVF